MNVSITFTEIDIKTDIDRLPLNCEIGILYKENGNKSNRFLTKQEAKDICLKLKKKNINTSLHVCGKTAIKSLMDKNLELVKYVQRIQVNGKLSVDKLTHICKSYPNHKIISQYFYKNRFLLETLAHNHQILIDSSRGTWVLPKKWEDIPTNKDIDYAGGLSVENIEIELPTILLTAKKDFWIDIQSNIRKDDWFNVETVHEFMNKAENVSNGNFKKYTKL